jgi:hypothetical protein
MGPVSPPAGEFDDLWTGGSFSSGTSCGRRVDGTIDCWAIQVDPWLPPPTDPLHGVNLGNRGGCGLTASGAVRCWGTIPEAPSGVYQAVSDHCRLSFAGIIECNASPAPSGAFRQLFSGGAIRSDGSVYFYSGRPAAPVEPLHKIASANDFACGIRADGTVTCWADSELAVPAGTFTEIATGAGYACAIRTDGTLSCWTAGAYDVPTPPAGTFTVLDVETFTACGIRSDQNLACWGTVWSEQVIPPPGPFTVVSAATDHVCALRPDRSIECFASNPLAPPFPFPPGPFDAITSYGSTTCGLRPDRSVECWGGSLR